MDAQQNAAGASALYGDAQSYLKEFTRICCSTLQETFLSVNHQGPMTYLRSRGLDDRAILEAFDVGYFEEQTHRADPASRIRGLEQRGAELIPYLTKHSAVRQSIGADARAAIPCLYGPAGNNLFNRRIVFPVYSAGGAIINVYGRSIDENNEFRHIYGSSRWSWFNIGRPAMKTAGSITITESVIDTLTFIACGIPTVTSLCAGPHRYGPNISHDQRIEFVNAGLVEELKAHTAVRVIYVCFDKDENFAGDLQAVAVAKIFVEAGFDVKLLHLPPNQDPNSLYMKAGTGPSERRARFLEYFTDMMSMATDFVMEEACLELDHLGLTEIQLKKAKTILEAVGRYYNRDDERLFDTKGGPLKQAK